LLEQRADLKAYPVTYEVRGRDQTRMLESILAAMDATGNRLTDIETDAIGEIRRVSFPLAATRRQHERLYNSLNSGAGIEHLYTFRDLEDD
jgi:putative Mg2+ transporter-C (MgtC) family protein